MSARSQRLRRRGESTRAQARVFLAVLRRDLYVTGASSRCSSPR